MATPPIANQPIARLKLANFKADQKIVDEDGKPTVQFLDYINTQNAKTTLVVNAIIASDATQNMILLTLSEQQQKLEAQQLTLETQQLELKDAQDKLEAQQILLEAAQAELAAQSLRIENTVNQILALYQAQEAAKKEVALQASYTDPANPLTASVPDADEKVIVTVAAHTRYYNADYPSISLPAGSFPNLLPSTGYVVYYDDPEFDGNVTYMISTDANQGNQTGARHRVGFINTPAVGATEPVPGTGGGVGGGGYCVWVDSYLPQGFRAGKAVVGHELTVLDSNDNIVSGSIRALKKISQSCVTVETITGIKLTMSTTTPVPVRGVEDLLLATDILGHHVAVLDGDHFRWEMVIDVVDAGILEVMAIDGGGVVYAAGDQQGRMIFQHNKPVRDNNFENVNEQ